MGLRNLTSLVLLCFMALYGAVETAVCATAPILMASAAVGTDCPPGMTMCPMHAGQPCCCNPENSAPAGDDGQGAEGPRFGAGCVGAPATPPVTYPVTPMFRFLIPEEAALESPAEPAVWIPGADERASDAAISPLTPPPQSFPV